MNFRKEWYVKQYYFLVPFYFLSSKKKVPFYFQFNVLLVPYIFFWYWCLGQVIVDTSNEIGGDGDVPHAAIGGARRMQVPEPSMQHRVMIEAVENHMPEVVIVDEIGTEAEAQACRSIAERGVMLIGTAHGERLANIIKNPTLSDLVILSL